MNDTTAPSKSSFTLTLLIAILGFVLFVIILAILYLPNRPAPLPDTTPSPAERKANLEELHKKEQNAATTYGWVDKSAGIVRVPIERAMELTLKDLQTDHRAKH